MSVTYRDIVPDYEVYKTLQTVQYCSLESQSAVWRQGQERYIQAMFSAIDRQCSILDIACGDGVGLRCFRDMGFTNVIGVEFNPKKVALARESGFPVLESDLHRLDTIADNTFDIVYSSHTLEHAYVPSVAIDELARVLKRGGCMYVVLPYPDFDPANGRAHGGKYELGTDVPDHGTSVIQFFLKHGLQLRDLAYDDFREPEIWLTMCKPFQNAAPGSEVVVPPHASEGGNGYRSIHLREGAQAAPASPSKDGIEKLCMSCGNLHLGCGDVRLPGFINVDVRATSATDLVLDCCTLDLLPPKTFSYIFSNAFLEHLYVDEREQCLKGVYRALRDNGIVIFTGLPDFEIIARAYLDREPGVTKPVPGARSQIFDLYHVHRYTHGAPETVTWRMEQFHKSLFDQQTIEDLLRRVGFSHFCVFRYCWGEERIPLSCGFLAFKQSPDTEITVDLLANFVGQFPSNVNVSTLRIVTSQ